MARKTGTNWPPDVDTDPDVFRARSVTTRCCANCGAEIGPDASAMGRGALLVLDAVRELLVGKVPADQIRDIVHSIAAKAGVDLV